MAADPKMLVKVPVREQDPKVRATNFDEVCYGYNAEEAVEESERCLHCKNAKCIQGCPVSINIPEFIAAIRKKDFKEAYNVISESSALPAVCGRVCPQESQCEGQCIRGIKGEPVSIGKHCIIGSGCTILPGVELGEGCSVGSMSLVNRSAEPWGVYVGIPARRVKERSRKLLEYCAEFESQL